MKQIRQVAESIQGAVESMKEAGEHHVSKAMVPLYGMILEALDRYGAGDPDIDNIVKSVRDLLKIEAPKKTTYTYNDDEGINA